MNGRRWCSLGARGALLILLGLGLGACVRSKVVVTSDPPGADIHMNNVHLGQTPVEMPFTWYWYYDIKAEKPGFDTVQERKRFRAPVYLWVPFDLLCEAMPFPITDTERVHLTLAPTVVRPTPEVVTN